MLFHQFIDIAKNEATKSPIKHKYGAVLIYNNKIVSKGYNTIRPVHTRLKQCVL